MHKRNILRKLFLFRLWTFFTSPFPAEYLATFSIKISEYFDFPYDQYLVEIGGN